MVSISTSKYGQKWLDNFDHYDRIVASTLIDNLMLVSASEFASKINAKLMAMASQADQNNQVIAFYAEREIDKENGTVKAIFPNSENGRALGDGVPPVQVDAVKQDVGSEGIVATFITKLCKANQSRCLPHPGPNLLRKQKVKKIIIVTDFIGSGRRLYDMMDAFSKVASINSWRSYKCISFEVVCYSATESGLKWVESHSLKPIVHVHVACPTIDESFEGQKLGAIKQLCKKYPKKARYSFGFGHTGSLIVFSHGIPNNAPAILYNSAGGWNPLFEGRSAIGADIDDISDPADRLVANSEKVLKIRNARKLLKNSESELWLGSVLIMDAIKKGLRTTTRLSGRTQIPLSQVETVLALALEAKWLTPRNTLTALGRRELRWSKWLKPQDEAIASQNDMFYFPTQLRAP